MTDLATISVESTLSNQRGRAILTTRNQHIIIDSPPLLGGPNEEMNPLDILLGALSTCGTFVFETAARELNLSPTHINIKVEAEFDPRGVKGVEGVDPRIQVFRVIISTQGLTNEEVSRLIDNFKTRCPIYTTLVRSAPIEFTIN